MLLGLFPQRDGLNLDGAIKDESLGAGCGDLLKDWNRKWLHGYVNALGSCSMFQVES